MSPDIKDSQVPHAWLHHDATRTSLGLLMLPPQEGTAPLNSPVYKTLADQPARHDPAASPSRSTNHTRLRFHWPLPQHCDGNSSGIRHVFRTN